MSENTSSCPLADGAMNRRAFLKRSGGVTMSVMLAGVPGFPQAAEIPAWVADYDRIRIARVSDLVRHEELYFEYPDENSSCFLVQMEGEAGGGVGPDRDIIAFHTRCPHMGGSLHRTYKKEHAVVGPCPMHLSTFDLRKHGMVVAGHSTESLPQVVLEVDNDWIYAVGMMGLIFGRTANEAG